MTRTYAIADLHGRFDLLDLAERAISDHAGTDVATIVTLGDYVNKGPASADVIEHLRRGPFAGRRLVCLKGNHDVIMLEALNDPARIPRWIENGGRRTLQSYGLSAADPPDPAVVPAEHRVWLENLQAMHVDAHRVFVHAGVDPALPLERQSEATMLWKRYPEGFPLGHGDHHVVHGHHPFRNGPKIFSGRTDLDTLAWVTGRLVIGVFDEDVAGGPIDLIEIRGSPYDAVG